MKTIIGLFMLATVVCGQNIDPVRLDQVTNIQCDDYLARIDNLFITLNSNPDTRGYIVISGTNEKLRRKLAYELWFEGAVAFRKFDPKLVQVVRGAETGEPTVTFWTIPTDSDYIPQKPVTWNFVLNANAEPFLFHDDLEQICGSPGFSRVLKEYLDANPDSRSNVVIYARNRRMYFRGLRDVKESLSNIPPYRIHYFYTQKQTLYPWSEYWIVPKRRK